ncbi:hypothetical protein [Italian clover phyllody phytoplasma]|uniref:hypothetical protein n=1 Tax=Italian clover phyllody phytoplasma TaxID=1196420 RepID=UPI0002D53F1C|nr:hypothetical protein [Italian clover phyllody phytoplasma]
MNRFKTELQNKSQIQKDNKKIKILITQDENNLRNSFLSKLQVVLKEIDFRYEMEKNDFNTMLAIDQKRDFYIVSFNTNENNGKNGNNNYLLALLDEIDNIPIEQKTAHKTENHSETETDQTGSNSYSEKIKQIQTILKDNYVHVPLFSKQQKNSITRDKIQNFKTDTFGNINWLDCPVPFFHTTFYFKMTL